MDVAREGSLTFLSFPPTPYLTTCLPSVVVAKVRCEVLDDRKVTMKIEG